MSEIHVLFFEKITCKRIFDVFFSFFVLFLTFPLFLAIMFFIRLSSKGKVIYMQDRFGKDGKIFKCLKFRTMHIEAEKQLKEILHNDPKLKKEWEEKQKLSFDPRIFAFGQFLRKTSLDELPQFINVLRGDLSVVGPRPYMIGQYKYLGSYARQILSIKPGITGLWQISGRSKMTFHERILLDADYVNRHSFFLDLLLIIKTVPALFYSRNAC